MKHLRNAYILSFFALFHSPKPFQEVTHITQEADFLSEAKGLNHYWREASQSFKVIMTDLS